MITYKKGAYPAWMVMTVITGRLFALSFFASLLSTRDILPEVPRIQDLHVSSSMANTSDMFPSPGPASIYNATIESESDQTEISMVPIAKVISVDITIEATLVTNTS
ncbi:hypothetical protein BJ165DRAFT_1058870 [Panaeolus papilionaceus]|nr:hypothetical protein BJ165DRAFT_1058870 [Panaeolus papilionaceus]